MLTSGGVAVRRDGHVPLAEHAYREIHARILTLQIPPGAMLDLSQLANELQVGATPVREALLRLAHERLITVQRSRGTFATEIRLSDVVAMADVRIALEGSAARWAASRFARGDEEEISALRDALRRHDPGNIPDALALDARVHRFIYRLAGNPMLESTLGPYLDHCVRAWSAVAQSICDTGFLRGHADALNAIAAGEGSLASSAVLEHVTIGISQLASTMRRGVLAGPTQTRPATFPG